MATFPTLADIYQARARIAGQVRYTPLVKSNTLSERLDCELFLKLECLQETGAFKLRGATNTLRSLTPEELTKGVVTASTGNHGRATSMAAKRLGTRAVICISEGVPDIKRNAIEALGGELRLAGATQDEAEIESVRLAKDENLVLVSAFDDPRVVAGQGTIGLELVEDLPDIDIAIIPLSGGGLLGGIALALKSINPAIQIIGVTMDQGAAMHASLIQGHPVEVEEVPTIADCLAGGIGPANGLTFDLCRDLIDQSLLVTETEIIEALRHLFFQERVIAEGGAAVGIAALLAGKVNTRGKRVAIVVSGQNIEMQKFLGLMH